MTYENGNVIELDTNERYFIYNQKNYNGRHFALVVDINNNDKIEIIEIVSDANGGVVKTIDDQKLKAELGKVFESEINQQ